MHIQVFLLPKFTYILGGIFLLFHSHFIHIYTTWESLSCYTHIGFYLKNNFILHIHGKGRKKNFTTHSHFAKPFHATCCHLGRHFRAIFNTHAYWQNTWLPILYTHTQQVFNKCFTSFRRNKTIMVQHLPNAGPKGELHLICSHFCAF